MDPSRIRELVVSLERAGHPPTRVHLPVEEYRPLLVHEDVETALVTDVEDPWTTVSSFEVVPDPDLGPGEGYAEVPLPAEVQRKASVAPTTPPGEVEDEDETEG